MGTPRHLQVFLWYRCQPHHKFSYFKKHKNIKIQILFLLPGALLSLWWADLLAEVWELDFWWIPGEKISPFIFLSWHVVQMRYCCNMILVEDFQLAASWDGRSRTILSLRPRILHSRRLMCIKNPDLKPTSQHCLERSHFGNLYRFNLILRPKWPFWQIGTASGRIWRESFHLHLASAACVVGIAATSKD